MRAAALAAVGAASRRWPSGSGSTRSPRAFPRTVVAATSPRCSTAGAACRRVERRDQRRRPRRWPRGDRAPRTRRRRRAAPRPVRHARRRELATAVGDLEADARSAQRTAHARRRRLRAARDAHLAAREAHDEAQRAARRAREDADAAGAAVERAPAERSPISSAELAELPRRRRGSRPIPRGRPTTDRAGGAAGRRATRRGRERDELAAPARRGARGVDGDARRGRGASRRGPAGAHASGPCARRASRSCEPVDPRRRASRSNEPAPSAPRSPAAPLADARSADGGGRDARPPPTRPSRGADAELLELEREQGGRRTSSASWSARHRPPRSRRRAATRRSRPWLRERELALDGLPALGGDGEAPDSRRDRRARRRGARGGAATRSPHARRRSDRSTRSRSRSIASWPARLEEMTDPGRRPARRDRLDRGADRPARRRDRRAVRRRLPRHRREVRRVLPAPLRRRLRLAADGATRPMATRRAASRSWSGRPASASSGWRCCRAASGR